LLLLLLLRALTLLPDAILRSATVRSLHILLCAVVQPVQTLKGHADWVFEIAWLDETRFVSAGRDKMLKLWQLPQASTAAAAGCDNTRYGAEAGAALSTIKYHTVSNCKLKLYKTPCIRM
jgi:WD40 repeat protein